jgi:hypothetical protein
MGRLKIFPEVREIPLLLKGEFSMNGITLREGMTISENERVEVYFNIHKSGFSIKSIDKRNPNKGKVIGYADHVQLKD